MFYNGGGETLERVAKRGGRRPIPGTIPGQIGWGSEQLGLVEDIPAHCREVGLVTFWSLPTQSIQWFNVLFLTGSVLSVSKQQRKKKKMWRTTL